MDEQVAQVGKDLQKQFTSGKWIINLSAGPECVLILAECRLLASKPEVMALDLPNSGLKYSTLYPNLMECIQVGAETFRQTGERMERIWHLANEMGKAGGMIESMLKYTDPNQTPARDRRFKLYATQSMEKIIESVEEIADVRRDFFRWKDLTTNLLRALEHKSAINVKQQKETEVKLREREVEKQQKEAELQQQREWQEIFEGNYRYAISIYEHLVNHLPNTISRASAIMTAAAAVSIAPDILVVGCAIGGLQLLRQQRVSAIGRLELETLSLREKLSQLSGEAQSLVKMTEYIREYFQCLRNLQQQIDVFMEFLSKIQSIIKITTERRYWVFNLEHTEEEQKEEWGDAELKKEMQTESYIMKTRFLLASKASELYNKVSRQFVIPGIDWLASIRSEGTSDESIERSITEIEEWRTKICRGAEDMIAVEEVKLIEDLGNLARDSAESFKQVAPDLWKNLSVAC